MHHFTYSDAVAALTSWTLLLYVNIYHNSRGLCSYITKTIFIQITDCVFHSGDITGRAEREGK